MAKYFVEMELRTFYLTEINADSEQDAVSIAMKNIDWMNTKPIDQVYGAHSVVEDLGDEETDDGTEA